LIVAQVSAGLTPSVYDAGLADVNDNGIVDIIDALIIAQYGAGLIPFLPELGSNATREEAEEYFFGE
jgi:hypothetical protein